MFFYNFILAEIDVARLKARKAQETSDLSSQTDNENIENKNHTSMECTQQKRYLNNSKPPSPPLFSLSCDGKIKVHYKDFITYNY